jgi:putative Holliday junction resolvase
MEARVAGWGKPDGANDPGVADPVALFTQTQKVDVQPENGRRDRAHQERLASRRAAGLYHCIVRVLAIDVGERRVGLAISDRTATLARPLEVVTVTGPADAIDRVASTVARLQSEDDGLQTIVVGVPSRLDGTPTDATPRVAAFIAMLKTRTPIEIVTEDERLTSLEAERRLAVTERNWRVRKTRVDSAAAAIILQDYLDRRKP